MKYVAILVLSILISFSSNSLTAQVCDQTLWNHVYHNYRLIVHDSCMSVTGRVNTIYSEADGDMHIRLQLDTQYNYMLNADNTAYEYGCMVCEPVCATTVTQTDAIASCAGFTNTVFLPATGEYVKITGPYVTDNDHGWNELHPVTSIVIVSPTIVASTATVTPEITIFPNPANNFVNFKLSQKPSSTVYITISDGLGRLAGQYQMQEMTSLKVNSKYWPNGKYFYHISQDGKAISGGSFVVEHL